ncbi:glutathione S-transferase-like [Myzus persicae]|uniref:glutathione transferase n=1 Tax=Myzus persicae TaxID=13164 RepID=A0AA95Z356_MYZPE|nr:glutathione S-transferase-like [Myzus persicae]XP_022171314.1 glutathione S-transferase-like [Myzus persicae]XP_022171320.1 glutathione S-transferase-like [Myzus persicae]XP_022171328.1 glutathione S-transferase-like [Myzus persicae]XP_022171331.1 glutathione S-transferase-like [Myzus persicae]XP_022171341.1 glutathione S-transferase-like [Myzus persicae]XP_022171348.1 glutathione S-transferase-like [Myzus persicae]WNH29289.1 glutathione S-transferase sigma 1 [Myzus persicae]
MTYKLTYFNFTALGEPIRFLLSYLDIDFEDNRIELEQWPSVKHTMPFGTLPLLEIDGKVLNQSSAICRYLAKKANLAGSDDWESLLIDIAVDNFKDFGQCLKSYWFDPNEESKAARYVTLVNETIPYHMDKFENIVRENNGYFVNGKLSWADLFVVGVLDHLIYRVNVDLLKDRPNLQALREKVLAVPKIKAWIEKRPLSFDIA